MATILRGGLLALALVVCAWFVLGTVQARDTHRARVLISGTGSLSPTQAHQARSLLGSAATLNPDLTVDILRAEVAIDRHRAAVAVRVLQSVTRREPQNLNAWAQLALAAAGAGDRELTALAARQASTLLPAIK
jgi:predicted Zn-dependent protease